MPPPAQLLVEDWRHHAAMTKHGFLLGILLLVIK
jgi:hypothetical protein